MKIRTDARVLTSTLLAVLGVVPAACGGRSQEVDDDSTGGDTGGYGGGGVTGGVGNSPSGGVGNSPSGGTGTSGSAGTTPTNPFPCENPVDLGAGTTGYAVCASGAKHRPSIQTCEVALPRPDPIPVVAGGTCTSDLDCQAMPYGHCGTAPSDGFRAPQFCMSGCATDADCAEGSICECGDFVGTCVGATCREDADCTPGFFCQTHDAAPGCDFVRYACQRPGDACGSDADCSPTTKCSAGYDGNLTRACLSPGCASGRPFLVLGELRTAPTLGRADWLAGSIWPDVDALSPLARERVAAWYAECAALEHASIASFSRFTLALLALGAPAELVAEAGRALGDEIAHARVAYDLASHFAGRALGPGPLAIEHALDSGASLEDTALATFVEGCLGETLGALEAREAAAHAADPGLAAALHRIADDEARHAALAFRFVAWALERSEPSLVPRLHTAFAAARFAENVTDSPSGDPVEALAEYGVLSARQRRAVRLEALTSVVGPCVSALVERPLRAQSATVKVLGGKESVV